ncbi:uncharacterized protein TRIVIDRAFT_65182 [Trichoderma virens Gv29-8]|uniref:Uncharacterized protein n=1 Tax=Hypocrea virens (strain Gv29-8 / FGSC 10586) TaxID=413071 RepID=G9NAY6_HYPVG|nr:uncharacterized protein TRIVIDRAFT_65182 [Trichoderma virens Gv29-8]EHK15996.1 hypothetical protein TRIVIDRAFT_65182 [Trichoderma virens Gv29-8]UKZ56232.1 hypothetical protein TrVGV298_010065 [Trichoderma virens]
MAKERLDVVVEVGWAGHGWRGGQPILSPIFEIARMRAQITEERVAGERSHAKTQAKQNTRPSLYGGGIHQRNSEYKHAQVSTPSKHCSCVSTKKLQEARRCFHPASRASSPSPSSVKGPTDLAGVCWQRLQQPLLLLLGFATTSGPVRYRYYLDGAVEKNSSEGPYFAGRCSVPRMRQSSTRSSITGSRAYTGPLPPSLIAQFRCQFPSSQSKTLIDRGEQPLKGHPQGQTDGKKKKKPGKASARCAVTLERAQTPLRCQVSRLGGPGRKTAKDHTVGDFWELDDGPGDVRTLAGLNPCPGGLENDFSPYRKFRMR